jgi:sterol desaturase/sphingolipid hydroxylase (fatty acid hydroxylase superfamily)
MMLIPALDFVGSPLLLGLFGVWFGLETARPLRVRIQRRSDRIRTNLALMALAGLVIRGLVVPATVALAGSLSALGWGLVPRLGLPTVLAGALAFVLMDYTTWVWHRLNHQVPLLWRFHGVHHTDLDLDVMTSFRFHVGELTLSLGFRALQIAVIGVGPAVLIGYEIVMEAATEFHHSNIKLPFGLERRLNLFVVTPRMHGIHHSIVERETNANWSVVFSCWDRLHRTLRLDVPQDAIVIGVPAYRSPGELTFGKLLALPFRRQRAWWRLPDGRFPERQLTTAPDRMAA